MPNSILFLLLALACLSTGSAASNSSLPCIPQLLPCQPYLKNPSNPPMSCCMPMNQVVDTELPCLCAVFNDTSIMRSFNVTRSDAILLATNCGVRSAGNLCPSDQSEAPDASPTIPPPTQPAAAAPPHPANPGVALSPRIGFGCIVTALGVALHAHVQEFWV